MTRKINRVAVLGSGIMGSRIACHFANIGVKVLLLDIVPGKLTPEEEKNGLSLESPKVRNRIVNDSLKSAIGSKPSPLYKKEYASRISTGNFEDNMKDIRESDWIIEVVVENLDIKKKVFEQVEKYREKGTLISSNTSGIPIHLMLEGRSEDFQKHFAGTHFFNPPRYLKLLEIIPTEKTASEVVDFYMHYGDLYLGKTTVLCKDTPAFIANRIGIYGIMETLKVVQEMGLRVEEVDKLTGPVVGRPKSATFRTMDVVGNDTLIKVANNLYEALPKDEQREVFKLPEILKKIEKNKWYGDKSGQGFYKKTRDEKGKRLILSLDLDSFEYTNQKKANFPTLEQTKSVDRVKDRFKILINGQDKAGEFYRRTFLSLFQYVSTRIPEISDELFRIDDAMKAGFGWEYGPYETWDFIGVEKAVKMMEEAKRKPAPWVYDMLKAGHKSFYKVEGAKRLYYDIPSRSYKEIPGRNQFILLDDLRENNILWSNPGATVFDIGDGVLNLEFHSKMNTLGGEVIEGINTAINMAEKDFRGLVIANEGNNFSAGANLAMLFMYAIEQEYDEIDFMIRTFQNTMMRARYSDIPVVVAPHNMALGGGCEMCLHADHVQAHAELYMGLVEFGVGLIPAGGGTKEMVKRVSQELEEGDIELNSLKNVFLNIGMAKVSTSAEEARDLKYLRRSDGITLNKNRQIAEAKAKVIEMDEAGYVQPKDLKNIKVPGKNGLGMFYSGANNMQAGHYISEHDKLISMKLAHVMVGGDISAPTEVSEQYLLDLEREAFLSLTGERKTLERIQSILQTGKPLRN